MGGSAYSKVRSELAELVKGASDSSNYSTEGVENTIDFSKGFGDISCSVAFRLAKEHKKDANSIANEIKSKLEKPDYVEKVTVENGFINFHLKRKEFTKIILDSSAETQKQKKRERAIIEYISVNPNKPWHVGHLRNALLGDSIANIYDALGYDVERENYIDDLGLQMAETTWWFINRNNKPDKKFDQWLGEEYVKVNQEISTNNDTKEGISKMLALMGQDGTYESKIERDIANGCITAQYETASSYGIYQNLMVWESDILHEHLLEKALVILRNYGFVSVPKNGDYANCTIMDLKKIKDLPEEFKGLKADVKVLIRSDGTPTYVAKDIAFHMWKLGMIENSFKYSIFMEKQKNGQPLYTTGPEGKAMDFAKADIAINVIDARQIQEQSLVKLAFAAMKKGKHADSIMHLAYGVVELESGALSGRKGTWVGYTADDLLRETRIKAHQLISSRFKFGKEEEEKVVKSVALSAIKFEFLKMGPEKKIVFSWERALNFEGNSGPYAQYMHARATRILEEAPKELLKRKVVDLPKINDGEFALVKLLSKQMDVVEKAAKELRPNVITEYVSELAHGFATFYENSPILKAESEDEKAFRIRLTLTFKNSMKGALELLGIEPLEKM
ncbi:MAG: arginine--tRNA ligase [Candidatus Micrarchaeales archaeon]